MKKIRAVAAAALLSCWGVGHATNNDLAPVLAASVGYLSGSFVTSTAFYGFSGMTVAFSGYGGDYSNTLAYCAFGALSDSQALTYGYSDSLTFAYLPDSDLYLTACVYAGGYSGDFVGYILDATASKPAAAKTSPQMVDRSLLDESALREQADAALRRLIDASR